MILRNNILFALITIIGLLAVIEGSFRLLESASPQAKKLFASPYIPLADNIPDSRLLKRGNPDFPDHDKKGFRNLKVPSSVDIVALGDSQTYGTNVMASESWPRQLEVMTKKSVYSMAIGGYAPVHSLLLWDEAFALKPKIIIEAFYAGNDLCECFYTVYNYGKLSDLKSSDIFTQKKIEESERRAPVLERAIKITEMGNPQVSVKNEPVKNESAKIIPEPVLYWFTYVKHGMDNYSKIYALCRRVFFELTPKKQKDFEREWKEKKIFAETHPELWDVFDNGQYRTIFTPKYRLTALDLNDPAIEEGLQISLRAIQRMNDFAMKTNSRFIVLLIPTKEAVFKELVSKPSKNYSLLAENEDKLWGIMKTYFQQHNIEHVDALPVLRGQLSSGTNPYQTPLAQDGHPSKNGHSAIAKLVANYLESTKNVKR